MKIRFTLLYCFIFSLSAVGQGLEQPGDYRTPYSEDTALANRYLEHAQLRVSNASTLDSARYYLRKAYSLSQSRNYTKGLAEYYRLLAVVYNVGSAYDSAMFAAEKELFWSKRTGLPYTLIEAYASKGIVFEYRDELDSATRYYIRALYIADSVQNKKMSGKLHNNLSILFHNIGDYKSSEKYAKEGYRVGRELNDSVIFLNCLFNLGSTKYDMEQYDTAMSLFEQVKQMVKHSPRYHHMAVKALINEGNILSDQGSPQASLEKYKKVLQEGETLSPYILRYVYSNMGSTLQQMGQLARAESHFQKAIRIDRQIRARDELRLDYRSLSEVKEAQRQFAAALNYRKKYDSLNETLMNESVKKDMHALQVKYQTAKKEKQIVQQHLALSQKQQSIERKNGLLLLLLGGFIALVIIFILSVRSYRHKRKLQEQSVLAMQRQHEINTLQARMEAREDERNRIGREMHDDIGSALTTILYLSGDLKSNTHADHQPIIERIVHLSEVVVDQMNEIIWSMNREYDTLDDLITYTRQHAVAFLENYNIDYRFEMPDPMPDIQLQGEQRRNIYLIVKEALHNVVKHAGATEVTVAFDLNDNLNVIIHDNGVGIHTGLLRRFGNGLHNMQQRMKAINGSFTITAVHGTKIRLECPLGNQVTV